MSRECNKNIKAIIFDFGGVITPIEPWAGWTPTPEARAQIKKAIFEIAKLFEKKLKDFKFSAINFKKEFRARTNNLTQEQTKRIIGSICVANKDVLDLIAELHSQYKIYGLVNAPFGWTELRRGIHKLDQYFSRVFVSYEIDVRKPDPKFFHYFFKNTGLKPEECLFIDDKKENVLVAKQLGMSGYIFDSIAGLKKHLRHKHILFI